SKKINVDYITESPFSFECKRITVLQFSNTRDLAIGEIMGMHARKSLIDLKKALRARGFELPGDVQDG
ncbi:MAG: hypothetical protein QF376_03375, partial [Anaerolineales bacterium]|nr:hypothetical protein [Anaerolineales bacterium]